MTDWTLEMIEEVEKLNVNTPYGQIIDADTILVDALQTTDFELSGIAQDIFNIYKESQDKLSVKKIFYEFVGVEFDEYLMKCQKEISRWINDFVWRKGE